MRVCSENDSSIGTPHIQQPPEGATPALVQQLRRRLEGQLTGSVPADRTSPGLEKLRNTPVGQGLRSKQRTLEAKHLSARSKVVSGGGFSLWPHMENMRLTGREVASLVVTSACLLLLTCLTFLSIHGAVLEDLSLYRLRLSTHWAEHGIAVTQGEAAFTQSLLQWHADLKTLVDQVEERFSLLGVDLKYVTYMLVYIAGILSLLYLLVDNIFSKSRLTPRRIKIWVSLLVVLGAWTLLSLYLFIAAYQLEMALQMVLRALSDKLGDLVFLTDLDLSVYHNVRLYWSGRCLPPLGSGVLSLFSLVSVLDLACYLQYYCVPVATALLTPVLKLIMGLVQVYTSAPRHSRNS